MVIPIVFNVRCELIISLTFDLKTDPNSYNDKSKLKVNKQYDHMISINCLITQWKVSSCVSKSYDLKKRS